ncbi:Nucleotide sugar epimerase/dehydratase WbpM [Sphingomonas antarctica]|uniref:polysaccharide biosynthesis protein n=1 Tax=Sphingomonas antarctica TaxID=2040274 RepID=UPI0039EBCB2D
MPESVPRMHRQLKEVAELPRAAKRLVAIIVDAAICLLTTWLAFYLRLGELPEFTDLRWVSVAASLTALPIFGLFGIYRAIFRYLGVDAIVVVGRACLIYGALYAALFTFLGIAGIPRTIGFIQPVLLFIFVCVSRMFVRSLLRGLVPRARDSRVLIYGAGSSGRQLAEAIGSSRTMHFVGYVDDDRSLHGSILNGRRIHGPDKLTRVVLREGVTDILLAMPRASHRRRAEIVEALRPLGLVVRTIPPLTDVASGRVQVSALRALDIEDLLGRDVAAPDPILFTRNIMGKTVLVTGAGGSIGSELCRQIVAAGAARLVLFESSEFALYAIERELRETAKPGTAEIVPLLGSVRDAARLFEVMRAWRPDTVYHAAAYKHVPMVEHNPLEGLANNVMGTRLTAQAAIDAGVADFVLISTDKAVRPTNVMGASKRFAELVLQALAEDGAATRLSMVRFGNVLGSSGSVVPLFRKQLADGGPVTITHEDVTRYFMTIPEAAQLVIQAGGMATTGGEVFILDMGEPVRIADLARKMTELSGLTVRHAAHPDGDIEIRTVGLRPGEKLYEELLIGDDPAPTAHPLIMRAREHHLPQAELSVLIDRLGIALAQHDVDAAIAVLKQAVREFAPTGDAGDLVALEHARCSNPAG